MLTSSRADFDVRMNLKKRTIFTRMTGVFSEDDMQAWAKEYREATDRFQGSKHMVIADMRGMKTVDPTVAERPGRSDRLCTWARGSPLRARFGRHGAAAPSSTGCPPKLTIGRRHRGGCLGRGRHESGGRGSE